MKYSYKAQNDDELTLTEGDIITVLSEDGQDAGWWKGELNGKIGVFPDNFVVIISDQDAKQTKPAQTPPEPTRPTSLKTTTTPEERQEATTRVTPPILGKKPSLPVKKSPSGSGGQSGGLFAGFRKKIADAVDGASSSKSQPVLVKASDLKDDRVSPENAFDRVERTPMLSDVRATRAKAPGRRPPSVVFKEGDSPGIPNGNADHAQIEELTETNNNNNRLSDGEVKPRAVKEWEKHKVPWLEEMKKNQAKRTSTSPEQLNKLKITEAEIKRISAPPEQSNRPKVMPPEKNPGVAETEEIKVQPKSPLIEKTSSFSEMPKSMPGVSIIYVIFTYSSTFSYLKHLLRVDFEISTILDR